MAQLTQGLSLLNIYKAFYRFEMGLDIHLKYDLFKTLLLGDILICSSV